jgi:hypothetical protein
MFVETSAVVPDRLSCFNIIAWVLFGVVVFNTMPRGVLKGVSEYSVV